MQSSDEFEGEKTAVSGDEGQDSGPSSGKKRKRDTKTHTNKAGLRVSTGTDVKNTGPTKQDIACAVSEIGEVCQHLKRGTFTGHCILLCRFKCVH